MKTRHFNDTPASPPPDYSCNNRFDYRRRSDSVFKKPRFSERDYHSHPKVPLSVNRPKLSIPFRSALCILFQRGKCYYGQNCHFAHSVSEINNPVFKPVAMNDLHLNLFGKSVFRKTRLCRKWEVCGVCPYGVKCSYAHGYAELQGPNNFHSRPKAVLSSDEVESKIAKKLQLKGRSYFANWDIEKISRIYADD